MLFGVLLGGVLVVLHRVQSMAVRDLGVMRGFFVAAGLVMLGGFAVMLGRVFVVIGRMLVMLMNCVVAHIYPPRFRRALPPAPSLR